MMKTLIIAVLVIIIFMFLININEELTNVNTDDIIWENKVSKINDIINKLKSDWAECGFNDFNLNQSELQIINSRKKLIEMLPITDLLPKLTYEQIRCFAEKFDKENYLVISKPIMNVPKILRPKNIIIVNNILYQSTPYGVIKYQIPKLSNVYKMTSLNASIEFGILNDYNNYNSTNDSIYHLEGRAIQKRNNKFFDIKNGDEYNIKNINNRIEFLNTKLQENMYNVTGTINLKRPVSVGGLIELNITDPNKLKKIKIENGVIVTTDSVSDSDKIINPDQIISPEQVNIDDLLKNLVSITEYDGIIYMIQPTEINPKSRWVKDVNNLLKENNLKIIGVIPHISYTNSFNYNLILVLDNDYSITISKNNISKIEDLKKLLGVSFNQNIPDNLGCSEIKVILEQMISANIINQQKEREILANYMCI